MDFQLNEFQIQMKESIEKFTQNECSRQYERELDLKEKFPEKTWNKLAAQGWMGINIPEEYGGSNGTVLDTTIMLEELTKGSFSLGLAFLLCNCFGANTIIHCASEEQKKKYLPPLAEGKLKFALGLTEPNGGTDALNLETRAERKGDNYIINGQKIFTSSADKADFIVLLARTSRTEKKSYGTTLFLIPTDSKGLSIVKVNTVGVRSSGTTQTFYDDLEISKEYVLGEVDKGWYHLLSTLNNERIGVAALCLGLAQAALEDMIEYAKIRTAFGKPIGQFQSIQHYIAEAYAQIESARLVTYNAAWLQSNNKECGLESTLAKMLASQAAMLTTDHGMQVMAGHGYTLESDMQRYWRDSRLYGFAPISNEMCKNYIGEKLGLPRSY